MEIRICYLELDLEVSSLFETLVQHTAVHHGAPGSSLVVLWCRHTRSRLSTRSVIFIAFFRPSPPFNTHSDGRLPTQPEQRRRQQQRCQHGDYDEQLSLE